MQNASVAVSHANSTLEDVDLDYYVPYADAMESAVSPTDVGCYEHLDREQNDRFMAYERVVGGYCMTAVAAAGLVGNLLSLIVLSRKEMRQKNNCFNNLLIGG